MGRNRTRTILPAMTEPTHTDEAPDALLMWNEGISGASLAISVERTSPPDGVKAFRAVGIDEDSGLGFVERSDGGRTFLTDINVRELGDALACDVFVLYEVTRDQTGFIEYPIERLPVPETLQAPGI